MIYLLLARSFVIKKFSKIFINLKESVIIKSVTHGVALVDAESLLHRTLPPDPMSVRRPGGSFPRDVRATPRVTRPGARSLLCPGLCQWHRLGWEWEMLIVVSCNNKYQPCLLGLRELPLLCLGVVFVSCFWYLSSVLLLLSMSSWYLTGDFLCATSGFCGGSWSKS